MIKKTIYLDNAAATPMDNRVRLVMEPYFSEKFYNPSAQYLNAKAVSKDIEKARGDIAHWLGCKPNEIIFTAGGTEANNLAIKGIMEQFPEANLVVSAIEHESVLKPAEIYNHKLAPVDKDGRVNISKLEALIDDKTVLISIMYANNEIGTVQSILDVSKLISKIRKSRKNDIPLYFHTDACQVPSYLDLHVTRLGVDLMTLNSGKIYGPKQFGALYVNRHVKLSAQILGGGQEGGMRSGTENPANIVGFAKALDIAQTSRIDETKMLNELKDFFIDEINKALPDAYINGSTRNRLPNNVHITIPGKDNELLLMELDELGILCASGSACSASNEEVSTTLTAIGLSEKDAQASLRFSMGRSTTKEDIEYVVKSLQKVVQDA